MFKNTLLFYKPIETVQAAIIKIKCMALNTI